MKKLTIKANIPEKDFMESLLNMKHSGYDVSLHIGLYALAHSWHHNKLIYYLKLLEIKERGKRKNGMSKM